jgi:hypothetical protein
LHRWVEFRLGLPIEQAAGLPFQRTVRLEQVSLAVYLDGMFFSYFVEPGQADIAEGSSVVVPDSNLYGFGHGFPPRLFVNGFR